MSGVVKGTCFEVSEWGKKEPAASLLKPYLHGGRIRSIQGGKGLKKIWSLNKAKKEGGGGGFKTFKKEMGIYRGDAAEIEKKREQGAYTQGALRKNVVIQKMPGDRKVWL